MSCAFSGTPTVRHPGAQQSHVEFPIGFNGIPHKPDASAFFNQRQFAFRVVVPFKRESPFSPAEQADARSGIGMKVLNIRFHGSCVRCEIATGKWEMFRRTDVIIKKVNKSSLFVNRSVA